MGAERVSRVLILGFLAAGVWTGPIMAAERPPLSAIEWLSNSIAIPAPPAAVGPPEPAATLPSDIAVTTLNAPVPDLAGLIEAHTLGLEPDLWGRSSAGDIARALAVLPDAHTAPSSLQGFLHDLMVAKLDPPIDATVDESLFLARIDRLLDLGQLASAERLIASAGATEPRRFRRAFDIALLTGTETDACKLIEQTPDISPTYPTRIFCLARGGQWDVAAITLGNAEALDILTPEEDQLLLHFLDPELFEGEALPLSLIHI